MAPVCKTVKACWISPRWKSRRAFDQAVEDAKRIFAWPTQPGVRIAVKEIAAHPDSVYDYNRKSAASWPWFPTAPRSSALAISAPPPAFR